MEKRIKQANPYTVKGINTPSLTPEASEAKGRRYEVISPNNWQPKSSKTLQIKSNEKQKWDYAMADQFSVPRNTRWEVTAMASHFRGKEGPSPHSHQQRSPEKAQCVFIRKIPYNCGEHFLSLFLACVYVYSVYTHVYQCSHMCGHTPGNLRLTLGAFFDCSHHIHWSRVSPSLHQTQSSGTQVLLDSLFWDSLLLPSRCWHHGWAVTTAALSTSCLRTFRASA